MSRPAVSVSGANVSGAKVAWVAGWLAIAGLLAGCPRGEGDREKSANRLEIAKDFLKNNNIEAARAEADKAIAYSRTNEEAFNLRGLISMLRARSNQQLIEIDACLDGLDAEALQQELDEHLMTADRDFAEAVRLAPDYGEAWSNRGVVANLLGIHADASTYLTRALESPHRLVEPGLTRSHLGWALFHQGDLVRAAKELLQAEQFRPGLCVATYRLGRVYFAREEWDKAAERFGQVVEQPDCRSQESAYYLMQARMEQGLINDARVARDACLSLSPKSCVAAKCQSDGAGLGQAPAESEGESP